MQDGAGDDGTEPSELGVDEAGLRGPIAFDVFYDSVGSSVSSETRKVFTSAAAYRSFFGHDAPSDVDFYYDWVAFYSAGSKSTGGYDASIESIDASQSGSTIYVKTRLESPATNCTVTQSTTKPYQLVRFTKPWPRARYVRFTKHDQTLWCDEPEPEPTCAVLRCGSGTHCVDSVGPAKCVADPCPGAGRRNSSTLKCECTVLGICPLGSWWNDAASVCGCE